MRSRIKKKTLILLSPLLFLFLTSPIAAYAIIPGLGAAAIAMIIIAVFYILQYVGAVLFSFAGFLASTILQVNYTILESNHFITTGWSIVRDLANLGFVLVIVIIAIATILRFREYGAQTLLPRLIAAAIIVNFSLAIAGIFIDFSHSLTKFFFAPIQRGGGPSQLVGAISGAFNPQKLFADPEVPEPPDPNNQVNFLEGLGRQTLLTVAGIVFTAIFTFIGAFVMLAFGLLLLLRYIALSFLLILAPIVWLFWVIPYFQKYFSDWWSSFLKWVFFAPAASFFMYLAIISIDKLGELGKKTTAQSFFEGGTLSTLMEQGVKIVVLTGFLLGGLIAAQQLGVKGASGLMSLGKRAGKGATKWAGTRANEGRVRMGTWGLRTKKGQEITGNLQAAGKTKAGDILKSVTGVKALGRGLNRAGARGEQIRVDRVKKNLDKITNDERLAQMTPALKGDKFAYAMARLEKNGNLNMLPPSVRYPTKGQKNLFSRLGMNNEFNNIEKSSGVNVTMAEALKKGDDTALQAAAKEHFGKYSQQDLNKVMLNDLMAKYDSKKQVFGLNEDSLTSLQTAIVHGIASNNPGNVSKIIMSVKGEKNFENAQSVIEGAKSTLTSKQADKVQTALNKIIALREGGELNAYGGGGPAPTASTSSGAPTSTT